MVSGEPSAGQVGAQAVAKVAASGDTVMKDGSLAAIGKWLTSGLPIGAYCPRPGLYRSSCGHREIKRWRTANRFRRVPSA